MTQHRRRVQDTVFAFLILLFVTASGCGPSKSQSFRSSFLPTLPHTTAESAEQNVPPAAPNLYAGETPNPLAGMAAAPKPTETEFRLMRAQERFEAGKRAYAHGDLATARQEFDKAIDTLLATPESAPDRERIERRLEQIVDAVYRYDVNGLGAGEDWDKVVYDKSPLDGMLQMTFPIDPRLKPKVKEEIQATVSQLPLEENDAVLAYIHFFSTDRGKKVLASGLKRAGRYKPMIERILREEGVPSELIYLAQAESGFLPRAVSYKRAAGMWQFVSWRGKQYGLEQSSYSDERLDPEKATRAAAKHLHDLFNQFGDWYLAMAAYNCGPGRVANAVGRTGYADFWKLRDLGVLPRETMNYVPLILAMTIVAKNPRDYGLDSVDLEAPVDFETVKLTAPTSLELIADVAELPVSQLRELNPSLLRAVTPGGFEIRVPRGSASAVSAALDSIPADRRSTWRMHRVEAGETLASIAKHYRTGAALIAEANPLLMDSPGEGDFVIIPASYTAKRPHGKTSRSLSRTKRTAATRATSSSFHRHTTPPRVKTASLRRTSATE